MTEPTQPLAGATVSVPLKPGDRVLVAIPRELNPSEVAQLRDQLADWLPDVEVVVLVGGTALVAPAEPDAPGPCGLCGTDPARGRARVSAPDGVGWIWLCHPDGAEHPDCYHLWTVYDRRPGQ